MLTVHNNITQGTEEWADLRRGILTASTIGRLITPSLSVADNETSRALTATLVAERLSGHTEDSPTTADMWRGIDSEPIARDLYTKHYAPVTEVGFLVHDDFSGIPLGYSPDGLVGDDGLIEIKAPRAKGHLNTILSGCVPTRYMSQVQCGLLVSGRKWCDYVSYCGGMPLWTRRVTPDPDWFAAIEAALYAFEHNAAVMVATYRAATDGLPPTERVDHYADLEIV